MQSFALVFGGVWREGCEKGEKDTMQFPKCTLIVKVACAIFLGYIPCLAWVAIRYGPGIAITMLALTMVMIWIVGSIVDWCMTESTPATSPPEEDRVSVHIINASKVWDTADPEETMPFAMDMK